MKTVALIGLSSKGHHLAFVRLFAKALLDNGHHVIVFFPENQLVSSWLKENSIHAENCSFFDYQEPNYQVSGWGRFNDAIAVFKKWMHLKKNLKEAARLHNMNIDIVFFTWLDAFLSAYLMPFILDFFFSYDWSGLYMHPRYMRDMPELQYKKPGISDVDVLLTWRRCKNIAVHDEGIVSLLRMRLGKGVVLFPETADDAKPDPDYIPSVEIKQKSKERVIVTIAGVLERMKGFLYMIRLAKKANSDQFYFVFAGPMSIKDFNEIEQKEIQDFIFSKPENCYFHFHFIPEGKEFNAFINGSDIIFIVYENFASSSNRLTKAAIFKKLVLAQNRFCVGEDVLKYNLGITVEEGNIEQMEEALMKLRDKIKRNDYPLMEFEEYRELHGEAMLKVRFKEIFNFDN